MDRPSPGGDDAVGRDAWVRRRVANGPHDCKPSRQAIFLPKYLPSSQRLHNANLHIITLQEQLTAALTRLSQYEVKEAANKGTQGERRSVNEDDPDQPPELSGLKKKLRSYIRAYSLLHSPWPDLRPLEYTYRPDYDPLDPFERYASPETNVPRDEAIAAQIWDFFPEEYLPFTAHEWVQKQVCSRRTWDALSF